MPRRRVLSEDNTVCVVLGYCGICELGSMRQTCRQINTLVDYIVSKCIAYVETEHYHIQSCLSNRTNVRKSLSVNPLRYLRELITPKVYILRGFISFSFDRERMRWTRLPDLLRDRGYFQTVVYKNEIFAIGTYRLTKEETAIPSSINIYKNKIYAINILYISLLAAGTIEKYNFLTNQWSAFPSMAIKSRSVGTVVFKGQILILGGINVSDDSVLASIFFFDESLRNWSPWRTELPTHRFRHASISFLDMLWVGGGNILVDGRISTTATMEVYCDETDSWRQGPSMTRRRDFFNLLVVQKRLFAGD